MFSKVRPRLDQIPAQHLSQPHQRLPLITGGSSDIKFGHHFVASKDAPLCTVCLNLLRSCSLYIKRHYDRSGVLKEMTS